MNISLTTFLFLCVFSICVLSGDDGVKFASPCEVCKIVSRELDARLRETGKSSEVIETGYSIENASKKKKTKYNKSELRLLESLDDLCERMLQYNIHKERTDSTRFAKGMSQTFKTLHGLVAKGVKVDLGIPEELWDKPSAEVTQLKTQCETFLEDNEDLIQDWYYHRQHESTLPSFLCEKHVLPENERKCLTDPETDGGDTTTVGCSMGRLVQASSLIPLNEAVDLVKSQF